MCVRKRKFYVSEKYFGWAGSGGGVCGGGKPMLDVSLYIPNRSAVAVIGADTSKLIVLGFTCDL
jgi:hypothetical protein